MSADKVLSQEEIDAMLSGGSTASEEAAPEVVAEPSVPAVIQEPLPPPAAAPMPPPPVDAAPQTPQAVVQSELNAEGTQLMLNKMMERMETIGAAIERIGQLENAAIESNAAIRQIRQDMQDMANQVQLVGSKIDGILSNLKATIGYRAQKTFTCSSCKTSGNVATRVRCTQCGEENWWGWWPQKK